MKSAGFFRGKGRFKRYTAMLLVCAFVCIGTGCGSTAIEQSEMLTEVQTELTETTERTVADTTTSKTTTTTSDTTTATETTTSESEITTTATVATEPPQTAAPIVVTDPPETAAPIVITESSADTPASTAPTTASTTAAAVTSQLQTLTNPIADGQLSGIKIGLDPGHQAKGDSSQETIAPWSKVTKNKVTNGAVGVSTGIAEYVTVLDISLMLREKLEAQGAVVYMTRETHDVNISNQERTKMMNAYGVDLMLRVHCDSAASSTARGIGLYVSASNTIAAQSYEYASIILPIVTQAVGANNRGITQNDNYTGQNWAEVPCIMIECGFISNPQDDVLLNSPDYQDQLTDGILAGIIACFQ